MLYKVVYRPNSKIVAEVALLADAIQILICLNRESEVPQYAITDGP